ncbi:hypothetical protein DSM106972_049600 [Dulcicalothrix desertica PCC 7102]|uniref:Uncharacterized protein n=1 Tax=Dulcicalothrix desertica PCC 7102 TaxID=232991 RepID=A0A3S1AM53_9CYAN|nr:hypothetical protein [Dulcicalothrix desertica]RUT04046.1 hypothetical protein DSM106972_049600 [Dulcicalothrix desertica PCC 7102]TWH43552.1 hypothetical protein CAL7102_07285 [Dulcicalothrix desertica PCC 7102]
MSGCLPIIPDDVETRLIASLRWFYYGCVPGHDIIGSLIDIAKKYQLPDFINLINISYAYNKVILDINSQGIECGLLKLKQYAQEIEEYKLTEILEKLKIVPRLLQLGATVEQIIETFNLNSESIKFLSE